MGDQKTRIQFVCISFINKEAGSSDLGEQWENDTKSTIK